MSGQPVGPHGVLASGTGVSAVRSDQAPYALRSLQMIVAVGVGGALIAAHVHSLALVLLMVTCVVAFDSHNLLSLRNFVLVYTGLVFGVGGQGLHFANPSIFPDILWYVVAFLVGYVAASLPSPLRGLSAGQLRPPAYKGPLRLASVQRALVALIMLNLAYLLVQFLRYGITGYYGGSALLAQTVSYGKASGAGGLDRIVTSGLTYSGIALITLYVVACFESQRPIAYRYPAMLLIVLPVLLLNRSNAVIGAFTLCAIFACDRRLAMRRPPNPSRKPGGGSVAPPGRRRAALVVTGMIVALTVGVFVASLRNGVTNQGAGPSAPSSTINTLESELTPARAYGDIKSNIGELGYQRGRTILLPFLLTVVPRAWFPGKPPNSGAYYMSKVRPAEWAAGLAVPPTFYGDTYLNFGFAGAIALCALLGMIVARLDAAYKTAAGILPWYLLMFANMYALLRDPLSTSLAGIFLTAAVWTIANRALRPDAHMTLPRLGGEPSRSFAHRSERTVPIALGQVTTEPAPDQSSVQEIAAISWYHTIELPGGLRTAGLYDTVAAARRSLLPDDLTGQRCLDVATANGFWAFEMERRGASEVVAIDIASASDLDWPRSDAAARTGFTPTVAGFQVAHRALGSKVQRREISVYDVSAEQLGRFDLVFLGSVLLHLRDPVRALMNLHGLTDGELILNESVDLPLSILRPRTPAGRLYYSGGPNWLVPNVAGLARIVRAAGFEVIEVTRPYPMRWGPGAAIQPGAGGMVRRLIRQRARGLFFKPHVGVRARPRRP